MDIWSGHRTCGVISIKVVVGATEGEREEERMKVRACGTRPFKGPEQTARAARNMGGNPGENDVLQAKERANFQEGGINVGRCFRQIKTKHAHWMCNMGMTRGAEVFLRGRRGRGGVDPVRGDAVPTKSGCGGAGVGTRGGYEGREGRFLFFFHCRRDSSLFKCHVNS